MTPCVAVVYRYTEYPLDAPYTVNLFSKVSQKNVHDTHKQELQKRASFLMSFYR